MAKKPNSNQYSLMISGLEPSRIFSKEASVYRCETARSAIRCSNGSQLVGLLFLLMALGGTTWGGVMILKQMKDTDRLPSLRLVVTGERHYTTDNDIRQAILALGGSKKSFMKQDVYAIQQQLERISWIQHADVLKQWPNKLKIRVIEYVPIARWNDLCLLDNSGTIFSAPISYTENHLLPMLYGLEGSEKSVLIGYLTMNEELMAAKFSLKTVSMNPRHSWRLTLRDNTVLELGSNERNKRLGRFIEIYPTLLKKAQKDGKRIIYVDLRYNSGIAIRWAASHIEPKKIPEN